LEKVCKKETVVDQSLNQNWRHPSNIQWSPTKRSSESWTKTTKLWVLH